MNYFDKNIEMEQILKKYLNRDIVSIIQEYNSCICGSKKESIMCEYKDSTQWIYICRICSEPWRWKKQCICRSLKSRPINARFKEYHACKKFICIDCALPWVLGGLVCSNAIRDPSIYCENCLMHSNKYKKCKICKKIYCLICIGRTCECLNCW